jgi:HAD superfamily hydrolase (TIGR01458 family)
MAMDTSDPSASLPAHAFQKYDASIHGQSQLKSCCCNLVISAGFAGDLSWLLMMMEAEVIRAVMLDIAGVLYEGDRPVSGARQAVSELVASGLPLRLVTNSTRRTKRALIERLLHMSFDVAPEDLFTAPAAAREYLKEKSLTIYPLIHPALEEEFTDFSAASPKAVLVADAGDRFVYANLNKAFRLLMDGAPLLAIAANRYFKDEDGLSLDAGPFVRALEFAADTEAMLFGKPAPAFFKAVLTDLNCEASEVVMVGDDVDADVNGAIAAGIKGILVKTGKYRKGDEDRMTKGGEAVSDVAAAVERVLSERE